MKYKDPFADLYGKPATPELVAEVDRRIAELTKKGQLCESGAVAEQDFNLDSESIQELFERELASRPNLSEAELEARRAGLYED